MTLACILTVESCVDIAILHQQNIFEPSSALALLHTKRTQPADVAVVKAALALAMVRSIDNSLESERLFQRYLHCVYTHTRGFKSVLSLYNFVSMVVNSYKA